jgi:hypothetical protein
VITIASVASTLTACGGSTSNDSGKGGSSATGGTHSGGSSGSGGSGGSGNVAGVGGSGNVSGSGGVPGCPTQFPQSDTSCSLPNGTQCFFDQGQCCPDWEAICQDGKWQALASSCNPPYIPCPVAPPVSGSACDSDPCAGSQKDCTYGQCADGSPYTIAQCTNGAWDVKQANCGPAPCEALSACDCFDRPDCEATSDSCICQCDFNCPGKPPCDCICGGGTFLGCKTKAGLP